MLINSYVIHDITAETYTFPFFAHNDKIAIRTLSNMVNTPGSSISDNPEDFRLYRSGEYDDQTGVLTEQRHDFIIRASDLLTRSLPGVDSQDNQPTDQ